jgi:hypothetical protein
MPASLSLSRAIYLEDVALLDLLVTAKLGREADAGLWRPGVPAAISSIRVLRRRPTIRV